MARRTNSRGLPMSGQPIRPGLQKVASVGLKKIASLLPAKKPMPKPMKIAVKRKSI